MTKCHFCKGNKQVTQIGMIYKDCPHCLGKGFVMTAQKVLADNKNDDLTKTDEIRRTNLLPKHSNSNLQHEIYEKHHDETGRPKITNKKRGVQKITRKQTKAKPYD